MRDMHNESIAHYSCIQMFSGEGRQDGQLGTFCCSAVGRHRGRGKGRLHPCAHLGYLHMVDVHQALVLPPLILTPTLQLELQRVKGLPKVACPRSGGRRALVTQSPTLSASGPCPPGLATLSDTRQYGVTPQEAKAEMRKNFKALRMQQLSLAGVSCQHPSSFHNTPWLPTLVSDPSLGDYPGSPECLSLCHALGLEHAGLWSLSSAPKSHFSSSTWECR
jgi:hypothetical protein